MRWMLLALAALCWAPAARAEGERAGEFDYYVLSLSWSAAWCALEGDARRDPQCQNGRGLTFVLHGLWPQYDTGWPSFCRTAERDPTRGETAAMADIMGGAGLAFYQWKSTGAARAFRRQITTGRPARPMTALWFPISSPASIAP